jgi:hypothetical protein
MKTSRNSILLSAFTALLSLVALIQSGAAQTYSAAGDFSATSNPNGAWSYGYSYGVGSAFFLDTTNTASLAGLALGGWMSNLDNRPGANWPYVVRNTTAHPVTNNVTTVYQPGQLGLLAGNSNEDCVVRWTAPSSGTFSIAATFSRLDTVFGSSAQVYILHNSSSFFNSGVNPGPASFSGPQSITVGDTIDFVVDDAGNGPNGNSIGLSATIVPEPGTLALVATALAGLLSFRFLKRK